MNLEQRSKRESRRSGTKRIKRWRKTEEDENQEKMKIRPNLKNVFYFPLKHSMSYGQCFRTPVSDTDFQEDGQHGQKIGKSSKIKNQD